MKWAGSIEGICKEQFMKQKVPLNIIRLVDNFYKKVEFQLDKEIGENFLIKFKGLNKNKTFFFEITDSKIIGGAYQYTISMCPSNEFETKKITIRCNINQLEHKLDYWGNWIKEYSNHSPVFDDPITQSYYDEIGPKFDFLDKDKFVKPYSINQQKQIELILDKVYNIIENENAEPNKKSELLALVESTKNATGSSVKAGIVDSLRKIVAMCYKVGLNLGEKVIVEVTAKIISSEIGNL